MITSYDISDRSTQSENPILDSSHIDVQTMCKAKPEGLKIRHSSSTSVDGITSSVVVEAVDSAGNVIRAESFRLRTVSSRTALASRLHAFEQVLIQDGFQVEADEV